MAKQKQQRWAKEHPPGYLIRLSFNMLAAMVDIEQGYDGEDSPRFRAATIEALRNRRYIIGSAKAAKLTTTGRAILPSALEVMKPWQSVTAAKKRRRRTG